MTKPHALIERVLQIDPAQARRLSKLTGDALEIASEGIIRHLRACTKMEIEPDSSAIREIIDDAMDGRRVYAETSNDLLYGNLGRDLPHQYDSRTANPESPAEDEDDSDLGLDN